MPFNDPPRTATQSANVGWIVAANGCHLWQGANVNGYGTVQMDGLTRKVHRVRYEREVGPIPEGLVLDHYVCDNPSCCNPAHVRPATERENILRGRGIAARMASQTHCLRGHPLSGDNVYMRQSDGGRECRECKRTRNREIERARLLTRNGNPRRRTPCRSRGPRSGHGPSGV